MKKIFTMAAMSIFAISANAATLELPLDNMTTGWGCTYDSETHIITYDEGAWKGKGWWLGDTDYSEYDKVVVEFEPTDFNVQLVIEYVEGESTKSSTPAGGNKVEAELNKEAAAHVKQIYIQNSAIGTLKLLSAYLTNNEPPVEYDTLELPLDNMTTGWGCDYDPETHIITFDQGAWKGKGWWLGDVDYSEYEKVVVEFEPTDFNVQLVIEYVEGESTKSSTPAGGNKVEAEFNKENAAHVKQIYVQNSAVGTLQLLAAYLAKPTNVGVEKMELSAESPAEYYNLQGVRVENPSNGIYICRQGNKVMKVLVK